MVLVAATAPSPAVVVAGDAFVDMISGVTAAGELCYVPHPGGSCLNVAVGLARLGVPTQLLARLSTDVFGAQIRRSLVDSGVGLRYVMDTTDPTCLAMAHLQDGVASYSFLSAGAADRSLLPEHVAGLPDGGALPPDAALHIGSVALVQEPQATTLDGILQRAAGHRFVSLDPNVRPGLVTDRDDYLRRMRERIAVADLVKASDEDIAWLHPGRAPEDVAAEWLDLGADLVLVTFGGAGAWGTTRQVQARVAAPPVTVVDTVGAGDAFMSGSLAYLYRTGLLRPDALQDMDEQSLAGLLNDAAAIAADTCTRAGADPPRRSGG